MHVCPDCEASVAKTATRCPSCGAWFGTDGQRRPVVRSNTPYRPNQVSAWNRFWYLVFCIVCVAYAAYSIHEGKFFLPAKRGPGVELRGLSLWLIVCALVVGVAHLASLVVDHYDKRDNEQSYKDFATLTKFGFWALFVVAVSMSCAS
jgi:hypothetical protein